MRQILGFLFLLVLPSMSAAQDDGGDFDFGGDVYRAGQLVILAEEVSADAFLAGQTVSVSSHVEGSLHAAGQTVRISGNIGGNLYAVGQTVDATGGVAGSVTALGQTLTVGDVGRNLRVTGQNVGLMGEIGGSALLAGETVTVEGAVSGDLSLAGVTLTFGTEASVGGTLTIYHDDPDSVIVAASVAPEDRIVRKTIEDWDADKPQVLPVSRRQIWRGFIATVVTVTAVAALMAALVPDWLAGVRGQLISAPARSLWFGFLTLSVLVGSMVVLAMTVIGLLGLPVSLALAIIGCTLGYVTGAYALGVWLMTRIGRPFPAHWWERAVGAVAGAIVVAFVGMIPLIGWLAALLLTLAGLGALSIVLMRPAFFVTAEA